MTTSVPAITLSGLAWGFVPALVVVAIMYRWTLGITAPLHALARMLIQLLLVGYVLTFIFNTEHATVIILVMSVMLLSAGWIALRPVAEKRPQLYLYALLAIALAGLPILMLVTQVVLGVEPWFMPRYVVPLAGMIFASSMNTVSLAAERFAAELSRNRSYVDARNIAFDASLIPTINSLLAVGLVALPGMMTGQILSGVPPLVAVRYQIVVMCILFGASGLSAAIYLWLGKRTLPASD